MKIIPTHGIAYFIVTKSQGINEILEFTYYDEEEYFPKILHNQKDFEREVNTLWSNMQHFLDKEKIVINGEHIMPEVTFVDVIPRGISTVTTIIYHIAMPANIISGDNVFETWTDEESTEYDFDIVWIFPTKCTIKEVLSKLDFEIFENKLLLWARKGDVVGGYEKIVVNIED